MSVDGGISAFDRFRTHLEDVERQCPACGDSDEAEWSVTEVGGDVAYRRRCPTCEAEWTRRIRSDRALRR